MKARTAQELATKVSITASLLFGLTGIIMVVIASPNGPPTGWLEKLLEILGFIVLASFGVSVGYKYLGK